MFRKLHSPRATVTILVDERPLIAEASDTVAAALLSAGILQFRRSAVSAAPRGPYCMMGACFECLVEVDGEPNRQACLTHVRDGMRIRTTSE